MMLEAQNRPYCYGGVGKFGGEKSEIRSKKARGGGGPSWAKARDWIARGKTLKTAEIPGGPSGPRLCRLPREATIQPKLLHHPTPQALWLWEHLAARGVRPKVGSRSSGGEGRRGPRVVLQYGPLRPSDHIPAAAPEAQKATAWRLWAALRANGRACGSSGLALWACKTTLRTKITAQVWGAKIPAAAPECQKARAWRPWGALRAKGRACGRSVRSLWACTESYVRSSPRRCGGPLAGELLPPLGLWRGLSLGCGVHHRPRHTVCRKVRTDPLRV